MPDNWFDRGQAAERRHPPDHRLLGSRCWVTAGGPIRHLRVRWFRLRVWWTFEGGRDRWHRVTLCRVGRHQWVPYWFGRSKAEVRTAHAPDGLVCAACGPRHMISERTVADSEGAVDRLIDSGRLVAAEPQVPCTSCGSRRRVFAHRGAEFRPACYLCLVEGDFTAKRSRGGRRGV